MTRSHSIGALGGYVRLSIADDALRETVYGLWSDLVASDLAASDLATAQLVAEVSVSGCGPWRIGDAETIRVATSRAEAVGLVCAAINEPLATRSPHFTTHAGVLVAGGEALVIPGVSGAGKTTLTAALLQRGWTYGSDEALALEWDTAIAHAYPRPLGISDWTAKTLAIQAGVDGVGERFVRAADLGARRAAEPFAVRHIVLPDRTSGTDRPRLERAQRMDAVEALLRRSFNHYRNPTLVLRLLADVVSGADVHVLRYGDPAAAADLLGGLAPPLREKP